jgi:hypothetical protein
MIRMAPMAGHFHAVRFYQDDESLCRIVASFLNEGIKEKQLGVVVATPEHAAAIRACLRAQCADAEQLETTGELLFLDADETLSTFMVPGTAASKHEMPDVVRFTDTMTGVLDRTRRGRTGGIVRVYGEMVNLLWERGNVDGAIRLERLWNQLATTRAFSLLCGYAMGHFYKDAGFDHVCSEHTHRVSDDGVLEPIRA